ncbi:uncharacterized protein LOC127080320 [Lathyrus oleraceus]|uniref:uncharacterized protein LOC127080320 n=1 Tax=Pisum sativum TaxID=3888 RepID=UPI0021D26851|nr:uncharacterized protein LOC127080320 [Pisum sativum]
MGRVYTLDAKKAKGNNDLIVGMCHLNNHPCFVLFDCKATHYFISIQCMERLALKAAPLSPSMVVTTAADDVVEIQWVCENCLLSVNVFIGYEEKIIIIPIDEATPKDVMTTILKESSERLKVAQVPVAYEFPEVFPEDVTSFPPEKEVVFSIDLIPGTNQIYVAPYHMSLLELRELKNQLEELLNKHFIQPSVSPWGALVFLLKEVMVECTYALTIVN